MEFIMDMVHHNPGEEPFETKFSNPQTLCEFGYNAQVFKHINTAITFKAVDENLFHNSPEALEWINKLSASISQEIDAAKAAGLKVYYHIDLFVLPKIIKERFQNQICDESGKISIDKEMTLHLHRILFDELFERFPEVDGLIIRVGETYLHDTPYHVGNGAVLYGSPETEKRQFIKLLNFLREEICQKHNKYLFFRTWDCFPDKFHANCDYYLDITNNVEPHEKLIFSIKHTALDFWRRVKFNECLTKGKHRQIIEVQCQREYEGKGAYPMYVMNGVIDGFSEIKEHKGIKDIIHDEHICGIYTWSRGGGWGGPYIKNEFWCDLNAYVISAYANKPELTEEKLFTEFAINKMKLSQEDAQKFRKVCEMAGEAVLKGRYVECYDAQFNESLMPCENWMRDDRLGGLKQLAPLFEYLYENDLTSTAITEKSDSIILWRNLRDIAETIYFPDKELGDFILTSILYGQRLFSLVYFAWEFMAALYENLEKGANNKDIIRHFAEEFYVSWKDYTNLSEFKSASSLYKLEYLNEPGLSQSLEIFENLK